MAKIIPIRQNANRYREQDNQWVISAGPNISPVTIQKGIELAGLKPLLSVDGIIVKADDFYLCSPTTLSFIQQSNNPHYSIQSNGPIKVKGKDVMIGKTVKIIEISINALRNTASELDIKNRKAGVSFVDYIFEGELVDGVPVNLVKQINYTLSGEAQRPEDSFGVYQLELGDEQTVYNISPLNADTRQPDGSLDKGKLEKFLRELNARLTRMREDFNGIKNVFNNGAPVKSVSDLPITQQAKTIQDEEDFPQLYKYTTLISVEVPELPPPTNTVDVTPPASGNPVTTTPPIVQLRMRKQTVFSKNVIPVWTNDPLIGDKGPRKKRIHEGDTFWGYFYKDWDHGQKVWVVYEADKKTLIGWGVADSNDYVDTV